MIKKTRYLNIRTIVRKRNPRSKRKDERRNLENKKLNMMSRNWMREILTSYNKNNWKEVVSTGWKGKPRLRRYRILMRMVRSKKRLTMTKMRATLPVKVGVGTESSHRTSRDYRRWWGKRVGTSSSPRTRSGFSRSRRTRRSSEWTFPRGTTTNWGNTQRAMTFRSKRLWKCSKTKTGTQR